MPSRPGGCRPACRRTRYSSCQPGPPSERGPWSGTSWLWRIWPEMRLRLTVAMAGVLTSSCVHDRRTAVATPSAPSVWDRQIRNATDAGDGDYRLKALGQRVAAEPDNIAIRLELAKLYRDRGFPEVALEICRLAAARFPESAEAQLALVHTLHDMKLPREAIAVLEAHPREAVEYYSWLGILRDQTGAWEAAEPEHRKAVE